ncbi:MAG: CapA family protein, partial [Euzebya sp.]
PITVAFAGDVHGEPPIEDALTQGDNPLAAVSSILSAADIAVINLETPISTLGTPAEKTFAFRADPALATALSQAGVDVVNMANNHGLDYGHAAAEQTRSLVAAAGMQAVGYGTDADSAYSPALFDVGGRTVAVVGLTRVLPTIDWAATGSRPGMASAYDLQAAVTAVRQAAAVADHVVVTIHWGRERYTCPDGDQLALASALAAAGADVIAGHHSHVLQGVQQIDDTLVAYSLGNFVFYARTPATRQTGVFTVTLDEDGVTDHTWVPAQIDGRGQPHPVASQAPIPQGETLTALSSGPQCGPPR